MKRILIGYDGSDASDEAISGLKRAGLFGKVQAVVLTAAEDRLPPAIRGFGLTGLSDDRLKAWSDQSLKKARGLAVRAARRVKALFPGWTVRPEAVLASPVRALLDKARLWGAGLIVMGAHGRSDGLRAMGSVSQLVLTQAPCSVRIGRAAAERKELRIVAAVDGSPGAGAAVAALLNRRWPEGSQARIISVMDARAAKGLRAAVDAGLPAAGWLEKVREGLVRGGFSGVSIRLLEGDAKQAVAAAAEEWKADCVFMGARSLSPARKLLLGSVSMAVAARAHCSVEIVRGG